MMTWAKDGGCDTDQICYEFILLVISRETAVVSVKTGREQEVIL